jgi:murein DD-endopeptidase MepM/ murein hydrolase activator NlpD
VRAVLSRTASSAAVVAAAVAAVPAAAPAAELGERTLERGDRGDDVRELQDVLGHAAAEAPPLRPDPLGGDATADRAPERAFPVGGRHTYGDGFGDRPSHQGADVLAACGTPLRAVTGGTVRQVRTEGSAGRYIVLRAGGSGEEFVYMHLSEVAVSGGERVTAGDRVGAVGRTGNATTCHLHFEAWSAPGWYAGGSPHDPMPDLRAAADA